MDTKLFGLEHLYVFMNPDFWTGHSPISYWIAVPLVFLAILSNLSALYLSLVGSFGWQPPRQLPEAKRQRRFFAVIAAHNEEAVIEDLLVSLQRQEYPKELFDIFVVADNCTDRTAELVREASFTVFERFNQEKKGKTWAIKDLLEHIEHDLGLKWWEEYEGMAMFDADNFIHPAFFTEMNKHFDLYPEVKAVQGYADTKNPDGNHLTAVYALAYWSAGRFWQTPRFRRKLSCGLAGTGFMLETKTLKRLGWNPKSMVEDLELTTQLVLEGELVHWNEWALIYDEKPLDLKVSYRQRERWMRGHWWCFLTYAPQVVSAWLKQPKLVYFDILIYLFAPAQTLINFFLVTFGYVWAFWAVTSHYLVHGHLQPWHALLLLWPAITLFQSLNLAIIAPRVYDLTHRPASIRPWWKYVAAIPMFWLYSLTWIPLTIQAMSRVKDQGSWVRTPHTQRVQKQPVR